MSYASLAAVVWLAVFAVVNVAASALVVLVWPMVRERIASWRPSSRSTVALVTRVFPAVTAVSAVAAVALIFVVFEPDNTDERAGVVLMGVASLGAALVIAGSARAAIALWSTRRLLREWETGATPLRLRGLLPAWQIDTGFPVVAVVGVLSPRLLVARTVVEACSTAELAAIEAHEAGHVDAGDNVWRLGFDAAPDVLAWTKTAADIARVWRDGREEAADDAAARAIHPVELASALVTVARLVPGTAVSPLAASAFYRGGGIERRVHRLLEPAPRTQMAPVGPLMIHAAVASGVLLSIFSLIGISAAAHTVYQVIELAVNGLP